MDTRHIYIDSRSRVTGTPASSTFTLSRSLHDIRSVQVRSFMLANTIFNIDPFNNQLIFTDGRSNQFLITLPPMFYTAQALVDKLNIIMHSVFTPPISVALRNNTLVWTAYPSVDVRDVVYMTGGSMSDVVGRYKPLSGNFETQLTLSSPAAVAVRCKQIQSSVEHITTHKNNVGTAPLLILHLARGYGNLEVYEPQTLYTENFQMHATDQLSFELVDPRTGRVLDEIAAWSMILRITST